MIIIYILLFLLAAKPLEIYGREIYQALKNRDQSKLKANLLFFGITVIVIAGLITAINRLK